MFLFRSTQYDFDGGGFNLKSSNFETLTVLEIGSLGAVRSLA